MIVSKSVRNIRGKDRERVTERKDREKRKGNREEERERRTEQK